MSLGSGYEIGFSDDFRRHAYTLLCNGAFSQANTTDFCQERHQEESAKNHKTRIGEIISKIAEGVIDVTFLELGIRNMCCRKWQH